MLVDDSEWLSTIQRDCRRFNLVVMQQPGKVFAAITQTYGVKMQTNALPQRKHLSLMIALMQTRVLTNQGQLPPLPEA